jgi:two-component system chemotaxis sensor kinase CheA
MNEQKRVLRTRYRADTLDQLGRLAPMIAKLRAGPVEAEHLGEVVRTLHLLKGDASLVGLPEIAAMLQGAELPVAAAAWDALDQTLAAIAREVEGLSESPEADDPDAVTPPAESPRLPRAPLPADELAELSDRLLELSTAYSRITAALTAAVRDTPTAALRGLAEEADAARRQLDDVVGAAWSLRRVSVEDELRRLSAQAVELAAAQGKALRIRVDGRGAELERATLDAVEAPLRHLIRNAVLHGIEAPEARGDKPPEATLVLEARFADGAIEIAVEDDGRGIDPAAVRAAAVEHGLIDDDEAAWLSDEAALELLFLLGPAAPAPGSGAGLDEVRVKIEGLGGAVHLSSRPGVGARFVLVVPASVTRERAILVESGGGVFALPRRAVTAVVRFGDQARYESSDEIYVEYGGMWAPLRGLDEVLGFAAGSPDASREDMPVLVLDALGRRHVFGVDRVEGERELMRRPAEGLIGQGGVVTASSILDDGRVAQWPSMPALLRGVRDRVRRGTAPMMRRTRCVLVVDDSPIVRELVCSILRTADFVPETAPDGEAAWSALEQAQPDLVVSDVEMPGIDGFALLHRIRARWPQLPVVMLTTRGSDEDRRRAAALGADAYVVKSEFEESSLVETVRRLTSEPPAA